MQANARFIFLFFFSIISSIFLFVGKPQIETRNIFFFFVVTLPSPPTYTYVWRRHILPNFARFSAILFDYSVSSWILRKPNSASHMICNGPRHGTCRVWCRMVTLFIAHESQHLMMRYSTRKTFMQTDATIAANSVRTAHNAHSVQRSERCSEAWQTTVCTQRASAWSRTLRPFGVDFPPAVAIRVK